MKFFHVALLLGYFGLFAVPARADFVTNGSFELGAFVDPGNGLMSLSLGSTAMTGWTVISAEIIWTENTVAIPYGVSASDGVMFLDLTGYHDNVPYGGVEQTITTTIGQSYEMSFDLGTNPIYGATQSLIATAGGISSLFTVTSSGNFQQYDHFTLDFVAISNSTQISFVGSSPSGFHIGLDNVSVVQTSAVPEPSSFALLGLGGIGLVICVYRRRATIV